VCREACEPGFTYNTQTASCDACANVDCTPPATCSESDPSGLASECAAEHRTCEEQPGGAACGGCLEGFRLEGATCVDEKLCGERECSDSEMLVRDGDSCTCQPRECVDGEAERPDGTCRTCDISCEGDGETGKPYPKTDASGACICEPKSGFFWPLGDAARALPCDEDQDDWITNTAYQALNAADPTLREIAQARCTLLQVDRVVLSNEYGQKLPVWSCEEGLGLSCAGKILPLPLVEPDRNDSDVKLSAAGDAAPSIGTDPQGRALSARELNAVTKACVSALADFDADGTPDLTEVQPAEPQNLLARWSSFAHFMELHRSYYQTPKSLDALGAFVIEERSRCDGDFPMGYDNEPGEYWLQCARRRDARFDADAPLPGFDFAAYSCLDPNTNEPVKQGSCPVPVPPVKPRPGVTTAPPHGLCDLLGAWDQNWRGMHHHSQFKCVLVSEDDVPQAVSIQDVRGSDAYLDFQRCLAKKSEGFACSAFPAAANLVGWAAVRYATKRKLPTLDGLFPVNQVAGCIDESEWTGLCPDDQPDHVGTIFKHGDEQDFGELVCGCGDLARDYFLDADGDGFGDPRSPLNACEQPQGYVLDQSDCNDGDPTVNPGFADAPDAQNMDSNCDGIDGDLAHSVFVEASRGDDRREGRAPGQAVKTIQRGLELAAACSPTPCDVLVAEGEYPQTQTLRLANGVSIYGGYTITFARPHDASAVRITGTANPLVLAERIDRITTLDRMTLRGASVTGAGEESVTVRVVESSTEGRLSFTNDIIEAGNGGNGGQGGNAGVTSCNAPGGNGASSFDCGSNQGGQGNAGGDTIRGGSGGGGGAANCPDACPLVGGDGVSNGGNGNSGGAGNHAGQGPQDGNRVGGFVSDDWRPSTAPSGNRGQHGTGGGGGGSGGAKRFRACFGCGTLIGGFGGHGGAGGCGGGGGGGGSQGGASIGVVLFKSNVSLAGTQIHRGAGGAGGRGGSGSQGSGGGGGANGEGTHNQCCGLICYNSGAGGRGGNGGAGGSGSGGAGGNGGPSIGVALVAQSQLGAAPAVDGGTGGAGGPGGNGASGAAGGPVGHTGDVKDTQNF
jgi:hypothetical protein